MRIGAALRTALATALAVALIVAGCGGEEGDEEPAPDPVELSAQRGCEGADLFTVSPEEVAPGDSIALVVENPPGNLKDLTYGLSGSVEVATEDGWADGSDAMVAQAVPEIALVLRPGEASEPSSDLIELTEDAEPAQLPRRQEHQRG